MAVKTIKRVWCCVLFLWCMNACSEQSNPLVSIHTEIGVIQLELFPKQAPITVENFLRYVDAGHYENAAFYRAVRLDNQAQNAVKIEVVQAGLGILGDAGLFPSIEHESTKKTGLRHELGTVSAARYAPGTANSEFFISLATLPELDYAGRRNPDGLGFAVFGRVVKGLDVVRRIHAMPTHQPKNGAPLEFTSGQMLLEPVKISRVVLDPCCGVRR